MLSNLPANHRPAPFRVYLRQKQSQPWCQGQSQVWAHTLWKTHPRGFHAVNSISAAQHGPATTSTPDSIPQQTWLTQPPKCITALCALFAIATSPSKPPPAWPGQRQGTWEKRSTSERRPAGDNAFQGREHLVEVLKDTILQRHGVTKGLDRSHSISGESSTGPTQKEQLLTSNFCRSSSLPSPPSGGTGTLKYSPSSWLSSLNLQGDRGQGQSVKPRSIAAVEQEKQTWGKRYSKQPLAGFLFRAGRVACSQACYTFLFLELLCGHQKMNILCLQDAQFSRSLSLPHPPHNCLSPTFCPLSVLLF